MSVGNIERMAYSNFKTVDEFEITNNLNENNSIQTNIYQFPQFKQALNNIEESAIQSDSFNSKVEPCSYFNSIKKIHETLVSSSNLSQGDKLEICRIERIYMKLYLKEILNKVY